MCPLLSTLFEIPTPMSRACSSCATIVSTTSRSVLQRDLYGLFAFWQQQYADVKGILNLKPVNRGMSWTYMFVMTIMWYTYWIFDESNGNMFERVLAFVHKHLHPSPSATRVAFISASIEHVFLWHSTRLSSLYVRRCRNHEYPPLLAFRLKIIVNARKDFRFSLFSFCNVV